MTIRILQRPLITLLAIAVLMAASLPAGAITSVNQNDLYEIALPEFGFLNQDGYDRDMGSLQTTRAMESRYGGKWSVYAWNALSGTPRHLFGSSIQMTDAVRSAEDLEAIARQVIAANADVLRADNAQLRLHAAPHALGKWVAHFQQTHDGLDVWQAKVRVAFSDTGKLLLMGSDYYSNVNVNTTPSLPGGTAIAIATGDLPYNPATDRIEGQPELLILPVPVSENGVEHHLVWRLKVRTENPLGAWMTHVDAHSGEILWRYNDIHFDFGGDTETDAQVYGICDGITVKPMPYVDITVSGVGSTTSDVNGDWNVAGGSGSATVSATLYGPYVYVTNYNGAEAAFSGTAAAGVPFTVDWDGSNARQDERDTFDATNHIHDFFDLFDPSFGYTNIRMHAYVNRTDGYCPGNAWWDGNINFCAAGGAYNNTGELQQVVHHEFGHGVQDYILGSQGSQGLGEGNGDILGNIITQDPIIGRGFYVGNCVSGIRNSDNNLVYPDDVVGQEIHYAGQVIAGFNWDAMVLLQDMYGGGANWDSPGTVLSAERWHYGRVLLHPNTQPDQVFATFFADDDNGNMDDGTPHHDIFCEAAANHNFDCPEILVGVFISHANLPYTPDTAQGYDVVGDAISLGGGIILPGSVSVFHRTNGGLFNQVPMSATGNPDEYMGTIPAQPFGSVVEYYLEASNDLGASGTSPRNAPTDLHYFQVDDEFVDEMEIATAWSLGTGGDDTASTGNWERADPQGTSYGGTPLQPEDDHTPAGTDCWVTGAAAGSGAGSFDVDGGITTLYSPRFDLVGASDVSFSYWRYYSNNLGNNTDDTWIVQLTNDDGANWVDVENMTTSPNAWEQIVVNLVDFFADPGLIQLRYIASDLGQGSLVEALVDDFILMGTFDLTPVDDGLTVKFVTNLAQNSPNPFNPKTEIRFSLEQAGRASLKVYDAQGRQLITLIDGPLDAGEQRLTWNGNDDSGNRLASGVYFYRLETETQVISKRMVLLK